MKKLFFLLLMMGLGASLYAVNVRIKGNASSCSFVDVVDMSTSNIYHFGSPYPTLWQSTSILTSATSSVNLTLVTGQTVPLSIPAAGTITSTYVMGTIMCNGNSYSVVVTVYAALLGGDIEIDIV